MAYQSGTIGNVPSDAGRDSFWTFEAVQERLVEALTLWRRAPDRERGWLHVKAYWPEMRRHHHYGDYADAEATPRALPLSRADVARMTEAAEWLAFVPERDRRLVVLALSEFAGGASQVSWSRLKRAMDIQFGVHGLRKRYSRAITGICTALNRRKSA